MPIIKDTVPVIRPQGNYTIVKYLDLSKFLSLLQRRSLFFCRLDKLEDPFEGTTAKPNFEDRIAYEEHLRDTFYKTQFTNDQLMAIVQSHYTAEERFKRLTCINCWNKEDDESVALWKIYSDFGKGIMIRSTIDKIEMSLSKATEEIRLSEINYIDYENERMADGNTFFPFIHKQKAYSYEKEVRLIHKKIPQTGLEWDWSKEEVQEGVYINTEIDLLIDEIIIGPFSPKWQFTLIEDICLKYGLNKTVKRSKLSLHQ